jgi:RNA recognition motif-containing protein
MEKLDNANVFVKFLPADMDDMALYKLFSPFGQIISAKVMVNPYTWKSLGYGYTKF